MCELDLISDPRIEVMNLGKELLYTQGFRFLMTLWMYRYSKETGLSIHEIIQIFKSKEIDVNYVAYISYSGYQRFKNLISDLKGG